MAKLRSEASSSDSSGLDTAIATYALVQSLMVRLVENGALSVRDGASVIEHASRNLRQHVEGFEAAAAILDEQAKLWLPTSMH